MDFYQSLEYNPGMTERYDATFQGRLTDDEIAKILAENPGLSLLHKNHIPVREELSWQDELTQLRDLVAKSKAMWEAKDETVVNAYGAYWELLLPKSEGTTRPRIPDREQSVAGIFQLLEASITGYAEKFPDNPLMEGSKRYRMLPKLLSPRNIRIVMYGHGLAGETKTLEELRSMEEYRGTMIANEAMIAADNMVFDYLVTNRGNLSSAKPGPTATA